MSKKLYVGGLSWNTDSDGLRAAFAEYGDIEDATVITDRETGRSRGFGFVTFADSASAQSALEMNGQSLDGRTIRVDVATDKRGGSGGGGGNRRPGGGGGGRRY